MPEKKTVEKVLVAFNLSFENIFLYQATNQLIFLWQYLEDIFRSM